MTLAVVRWTEEPSIAVGLLDRKKSARIQLVGAYRTAEGIQVEPGEIDLHAERGEVYCSGSVKLSGSQLTFVPLDLESCFFSLEAMIGIDFHWQQKETESFRGTLRVIAEDDDRLTVINDVLLETYITSVICSEMNAASPPAGIRSHAVISRSWLLAQLENAELPSQKATSVTSNHIRWTEREAHNKFDVCADDHCQRYQGINRTAATEVAQAIADTRGAILTYGGKVCDTRFSKCCGGVVEEYRTAWGNREVPYLVALADSANTSLPAEPLTIEEAFRDFVDRPPECYCNCSDEDILKRVLNEYDVTTGDFFRWQVRLEADEAAALLQKKLGVNLGRILALEPVQRGPSGRLCQLRLIGRKGSTVIGKELEIRRALSPSHLYSSAFYINLEGPAEEPTAFVLEGAGWGHGVGLCQIGAAVMACQGIEYQKILDHYYPGTSLERLYS